MHIFKIYSVESGTTTWFDCETEDLEHFYLHKTSEYALHGNHSLQEIFITCQNGKFTYDRFVTPEMKEDIQERILEYIREAEF